jgi:hypothetical protein
MYFSTVAADTAPTDAAKYDDDHKVGIRDFRLGHRPKRNGEARS